MNEKTPPREIHPLAYLTGAERYLKAANFLFGAEQNRTDLSDVIYMLLFHSIELALKGLLRATGTSTLKVKQLRHDLPGLLRRSRDQAGLSMGNVNAESNLSNVVGLLQAGNAEEGFRYFTAKSRQMPDLAWARSTTEQLLPAVRSLMQHVPTTGNNGDFVINMTWNIEQKV